MDARRNLDIRTTVTGPSLPYRTTVATLELEGIPATMEGIRPTMAGTTTTADMALAGTLFTVPTAAAHFHRADRTVAVHFHKVDRTAEGRFLAVDRMAEVASPFILDAKAFKAHWDRMVTLFALGGSTQ